MGLDWPQAATDALRRNDHRTIAAGAVAGLGAALAIGGMEWLSAPAVAPALVVEPVAQGPRRHVRMAWRPRFGSATRTGRRRGPARRCADGRPRVWSDGRSRRWWMPAISPRADHTAPPRRAHPATRSPRRGTDIAAYAAARARAPGAAVRRARASGSSALPPRAASRAEAGPRRSGRRGLDPN